uniref:Bm13222 n=1 Tax=Brugia malayi TaxID=6279 RepID=A0A1I9G670_BRUMA|nr:Bm13222 [Brugia malayi]
MTLVISSPSKSTTALATLILFIKRCIVAKRRICLFVKEFNLIDIIYLTKKQNILRLAVVSTEFN